MCSRSRSDCKSIAKNDFPRCGRNCRPHSFVSVEPSFTVCSVCPSLRRSQGCVTAFFGGTGVSSAPVWEDPPMPYGASLQNLVFRLRNVQGDCAVKSLTCVREPRRRSRFRSRVSAPLSARNRVQTCLNVILALVTSAGGSSGCTFHFLCLTTMCPMGGDLGDVECRRLGRSAMMDHKADAVMPLVARLGAWMLYLHGSLVRAQWQPIYHL